MHITFGGIHKDNLDELRLLNDTTFPVRYNDRFYAEILTTLPEFTKYAYHKGFVVGAICCRLEPSVATLSSLTPSEGGGGGDSHQQHQQEHPSVVVPEGGGGGGGTGKKEQKQKLYIMTLGVQAAYRGHAIGSRLLRSVLEAAASPTHAERIEEIYLHVQTSNQDAMHFYSKFGFVTKELIRNYYKRIEPPDCYILSLTLDTSPPVKGSSSQEMELLQREEERAEAAAVPAEPRAIHSGFVPGFSP